MAKKVSKAKYRETKALIEEGEKAVKRARRNAYLFASIFMVMDFLLGFFISSLRFSFAGLENIAFVMLWISILFSVIATLLFTMTSLDDYYRQKHELDALKEEFKKMDV